MNGEETIGLELILKLLFEKKGKNIIALDVRGISTLTDYFIIVEGNVSTHVIALAKALMEAMKERGISPIGVEGLQEGDWVVIDYREIVVHILVPFLREKYALEQLWKEGAIVECNL